MPPTVILFTTSVAFTVNSEGTVAFMLKFALVIVEPLAKVTEKLPILLPLALPVKKSKSSINRSKFATGLSNAIVIVWFCLSLNAIELSNVFAINSLCVVEAESVTIFPSLSIVPEAVFDEAPGFEKIDLDGVLVPGHSTLSKIPSLSLSKSRASGTPSLSLSLQVLIYASK